jgi:hypothetical protein
MLLRHVKPDYVSITKEVTKCQLYKTVIRATVLYGAESWALSKAHEDLLGDFEERF